MSASTATTVRTRFEDISTAGPPLQLVRRQPASPRRLPFTLLVIAMVGAGLVGLLIVNTSMQAGAFEAGRLQQRNELLAEQQGDLQRQVQQLSSPESVTRRAATLGMVAEPNPGFLRLSDSKVLGDPQPAERKHPSSATRPKVAAPAAKPPAKPTAAKRPTTKKATKTTTRTKGTR